MSKLVHIRPGRCRWCCWLWDLRDMSGLHSRCIWQRIWWLGRGHEWMRNDEEPVDVVRCTMTWHNARLTCWHKMVWVVHPPVVYLIKWHPWINRRSRNTLDVSKLPHDPLWSITNNNGPPAELTGIAWNQMKLPDPLVLPIWHPADIRNPNSVLVLPVRPCRYVLHSLLRSNPPIGMWWILVVVRISVALRDWQKVLVYQTLQRLHENHTNFKLTSKIP